MIGERWSCFRGHSESRRRCPLYLQWHVSHLPGLTVSRGVSLYQRPLPSLPVWTSSQTVYSSKMIDKASHLCPWLVLTSPSRVCSHSSWLSVGKLASVQWTSKGFLGFWISVYVHICKCLCVCARVCAFDLLHESLWTGSSQDFHGICNLRDSIKHWQKILTSLEKLATAAMGYLGCRVRIQTEIPYETVT